MLFGIIFGSDHASRCDRIFKGKFNQFLFLRAATVDFLRCLELRFDWGLYIWTQQIEGVVMAWLSIVFKVCLEFVHMKTQHIEGVTKKVIISQWNELRADINKVCFGVCTYENTAEGRETKHCKQKRPVKNRWSRRTGGEVQIRLHGCMRLQLHNLKANRNHWHTYRQIS